jgi:hypothetical protein
MTKEEKYLEFIHEVAVLFDADIEDMEDLDAADFKDKAGDTWDLVEKARELVNESEEG